MAREPREQIIDRILDAAVECILQYGIDEVQITQIAAKSDMSSRTLSRYYSEKEALLADAATRYLWKIYVSLAEQFEAAPKENLSGRDKLLMFLSSQKDYFKTKTIEAMMMIDLRFYRVRHSDASTSWTIPGGDLVRKIVIDCIEEGKHDGSVRQELDPSMTSMLISATYNGMMQRLTMTHRSHMPDDDKERLYRIFDHYIEMAERYLRP